MVTRQPGPDDDPQLQALTSLAGWRQFASEVPAVPQLLDTGVWQGLDPGKRAAYDDDRIAHHSRLLVVQTPAVRDVVTTGRRLAHMNRSAHYGRSGLIVSGPARTGKTTAITQLGKTIEVIHRRRHPGCGEDIPVVYVTVPPAATPRMIAAEFARFLGIPVTRQANITDIIEAVCGVCTDTRVTAVCVDEIHNLNIATRTGAEASDTLKYFSERIPATFVLAGINVERAGCCPALAASRSPADTPWSAPAPSPATRQWATLAAAIEGSLRLHRHQPGTLPDLAGYLHQRTGGMIGSLLWLIRSAAIQAVIDGTEKITRESMDPIPVDIASQAGQPRQGNAVTSSNGPPLPLRPRPRHGETADSYLRRLAAANHLRFTYLRRYVATPRGSYGLIDPGQLAVLASRSPTRSCAPSPNWRQRPPSQAHGDTPGRKPIGTRQPGGRSTPPSAATPATA